MEKDLSAYYLLIKKASKEKNSRKKISKDLDKAKSQYGELKADLDALEEEKAKLEEKLNKVKGECSAARKRMLKLHKTVQSMDISNASDAIFYNDDSDDVGFMIRGKEYHIQFDSDGEAELVPMLQHRRSRKQKDEVEEMPEEDLDNLYLNLVDYQ